MPNLPGYGIEDYLESSFSSVVNQPSAYGNGNDDANAEDGNGNVWR